jgi:hypothetical protein
MNFKKLIIVWLVVGLITPVLAQTHGQFFEKADRFFKSHVSSGRVSYEEIKKDALELNYLLDYLAKNGPLEVNNDVEKAMLINAYNLFVIKGIVDNYPTDSPLSLAGFFDNKVYVLGGKKISLNQLEKEILIKQTGDERLHFALVCAAVGCPQIASFAYQPAGLDKLLDERSRLAMNSTYFTRVNKAEKKVELSQIFNWYASDFNSNGSTVLNFVNRYRDDKIPSNYKISFYEYDWKLNESGNKQGLLNPEKKSSDKPESNLLQFTPSQLFAKGQYELNVFNNLYTQTSVRDSEGNEIDGDRLNILTSTIQFTYGISRNSRVNIGVDAVVSGGSVGPSTGSAFQFFTGDNTARGAALSYLGPRVKWQPVKKWSFYSIQSTFLFPISEDLEQRGDGVFTALNRYSWNTQFLYDIKLTEEFRIFYQFAVNYWIRRNREDVFFPTNFVDLPSTLFINYFPTPKLNPFAFVQYNGRYGNTDIPSENPNARFGLLQNSWQIGAGLKYQVTDRLGLEVSYGNFVSSKGFEGIEAGAGEVINFAIRFIK